MKKNIKENINNTDLFVVLPMHSADDLAFYLTDNYIDVSVRVGDRKGFILQASRIKDLISEFDLEDIFGIYECPEWLANEESAEPVINLKDISDGEIYDIYSFFELNEELNESKKIKEEYDDVDPYLDMEAEAAEAIGDAFRNYISFYNEVHGDKDEFMRRFADVDSKGFEFDPVETWNDIISLEEEEMDGMTRWAVENDIALGGGNRRVTKKEAGEYADYENYLYNTRKYRESLDKKFKESRRRYKEMAIERPSDKKKRIDAEQQVKNKMKKLRNEAADFAAHVGFGRLSNEGIWGANFTHEFYKILADFNPKEFSEYKLEDCFDNSVVMLMHGCGEHYINKRYFTGNPEDQELSNVLKPNNKITDKDFEMLMNCGTFKLTLNFSHKLIQAINDSDEITDFLNNKELEIRKDFNRISPFCKVDVSHYRFVIEFPAKEWHQVDKYLRHKALIIN